LGLAANAEGTAIPTLAKVAAAATPATATHFPLRVIRLFNGTITPFGSVTDIPEYLRMVAAHIVACGIGQVDDQAGSRRLGSGHLDQRSDGFRLNA